MIQRIERKYKFNKPVIDLGLECFVLSTVTSEAAVRKVEGIYAPGRQ